MVKEYAYPFSYKDRDDYETVNPGMMLRDYFAAAALTGILATARNPNDAAAYRDLSAIDAYVFADAMLAERAKETP